MGFKRLDLLTDDELRKELEIVKLLRERTRRRLSGDRELFKDSDGHTIPDCLTTSELIAQLNPEPTGTCR